MNNMKHRRLQELDRSDFQIVGGEPDIRGWDVKNSNRKKIGEVEELILDAKEKKVRYMVVDLDDNELKLEHRKVLIPIGLAELDERDDDVLIPGVAEEQLSNLPAYDMNNLTADVERRIFSTLERPGAETMPRRSIIKRDEKDVIEGKENDEPDPDFYRHEYYNLDNLYKNRMHEAEPVNKKNESEYERGLRLWERTSEGTVIPGESRRQATGSPAAEDRYNYREIDEEARMDMIKNRRDNYRQRRYPDDLPPQRSDRHNERRNDESLPDDR